MFQLIRRGGNLATVSVCLGVVSGLAITIGPQEVAAQSNLRPTVSVTSPTTGAIYSAGAPIPFSVAASDPDGTIT